MEKKEQKIILSDEELDRISGGESDDSGAATDNQTPTVLDSYLTACPKCHQDKLRVTITSLNDNIRMTRKCENPGCGYKVG